MASSNQNSAFTTLLEKLRVRDSRVTSFSLEATKTVVKNNILLTDTRYLFDFQKDQFFKIHLNGASGERIIMGTHDEVVEYLPKNNQALRTSLQTLSMREKKEKYFKAIQRINIPYLFIADELAQISLSDIAIAQQNDFLGKHFTKLSFVRPYTNRLVHFDLWIDDETLITSKVVIRDSKNHELLVAYQANSPVLYNRELWLPQQIELTTYYKGQESKEIITIENFILNKKFSFSYSTLSLPKSVTTETKKAKTKTSESMIPAKSSNKPSKETSLSAAFLSFIFLPGTGEWLINDTQSFKQCCIEHLIILIPIIGLFNWIGSVIDAYHKEPSARSNWLFTTMDL